MQQYDEQHPYTARSSFGLLLLLLTILCLGLSAPSSASDVSNSKHPEADEQRGITAGTDVNAVLLEELEELIALKQQKIQLMQNRLLHKQQEEVDDEYSGTDMLQELIIDADGSIHSLQLHDDDDHDDQDLGDDQEERHDVETNSQHIPRTSSFPSASSPEPLRALKKDVDITDDDTLSPNTLAARQKRRVGKKRKMSPLITLPIPYLVSRVPLFLLAGGHSHYLPVLSQEKHQRHYEAGVI